ncbi:MAG: GH92 family glycosyl hydrolase [Myxococcota bacterium]
MTTRTTSSWSGLLLSAVLAGCDASWQPVDDAGEPPDWVTDPLAYVDPFVATGGPGFQVGSSTPAAGAPFGLVKIGPDTSLGSAWLGAYHCSGYYWDDTHVDGFSHVHLHGVGVPDYGQILFMPTDGWDATKRSPDGYRQAFSHDDERAGAGWYDVTLADGIRVELSATTRAAHHRYTFPHEVADPVVLIDLAHVLGGTNLGGEIAVEGDTVSGYMTGAGSFTGGGVPVYFHAVFDGGIASFGTWGDDEGVDGRAVATGSTLGAWIRPATRAFDVRVGISLVDVDGARANLEAELPSRPLEDTVAETEAAWRDAVGVVEIAGGTDEERTIFFTALYHALQMPTIQTDADGRYVGFDKAVHTAEGFTFHSDLSLWDTYRTAHPLYLLLWPDKGRDFAISLLTMAQQGGAFPRWPAMSGEGGSMLGAPADIVLAETWLKGVRDWDVDDAWPRLVSQANGAAVPYNGRPDVASLEAYGYYPADLFGTSVAWTQELAWADHALAQMAVSLGDTENAARFAWRSYTWRNLYDPDVGFIHARYSDGTFAGDFDAETWQEEYAEGNAWQYLWLAFQHPDALAETLGGEQAAREKLRQFFELAEAEGQLIGPQTYYWHGNEPDIHAAYLFTLWGDRDASLKWQRWIREELYHADPVGLAGNDDAGTLSAWYVFSALGFYPIAGTPLYVVGEPVFDAARFRVGDGWFEVARDGDGDHVVASELNGVDHPGETLRHDDLVAGGSWVVTLE